MGEIYRRILTPKSDFNNFIEIRLRYECSPANLLYIFRTPFYKKTCGGLLLEFKTTNAGRHFLHKNEFHTFLSAIISLT